DYNPERVIVKVDNYGNVNKEDIAVGDSFNGNITGVMDYSFGNFKLIQTSELPQYVKSGFKREETSLVSSGSDLTVATFNVENFIQNPSSSKDIERLKLTAKSIVENLKIPDILSLEEIQDSNGNKNDGVVDSDSTLNLLVNEIKNLSGIKYSYTYVSPESGKDGGEPGGNIRNVFLYREDKGVKLFNKNPGGATEAVSISGEGEKASLSKNPARIDPSNAAFNSSRKPTVAEFVYKGNKIFVIGNHLNSKGGDSKLFGTSQPPVLSSEIQRMKQAAVIRNFSEDLNKKNPNANIIVLGDLNDFEFSNPINEIKGTILSNLIEKVDKKERYTYNFEGNSQVLDHIIASNNLYKDAEVDIVHINADFTSSKIKTSDHDPVIAKFKLTDKGDIPVGPTDPVDPVDPPKPGEVSKPKVNDLIITEVYGGGGNTGSVFGRDYVEIYNNSDKELDLTGLKIIYSSDKGNDSSDITPLSGSLKPGAVLLVLQDDNGKNIPVDLKESDNLRII
ncbi:MAG: lamin tail domain-containing protein, partial [Clostridium sp.]